MEKGLSGLESIVVFKNSQGDSGRGTLIHITRKMIVFEIYNPYSILQLSEVLDGVSVQRGERTIYHGRAVVSNLVATGLMFIVSATLVDQWRDMAGLKPGEGLRTETKRFLQDWEVSHSIQTSYQTIVNTIGDFLGELSHWLEESEVAVVGEDGVEKKPELAEEFLDEVEAPIALKVGELFEEFEEEAGKIPEEDLVIHKAFTRRQLHPLMLCSPFVHRSYVKPLGYAGDFEMVNMMLFESDAKCANTYARIVDKSYIMTQAPEAHRNRIVMLKERLLNEAERVAAEERMLTVLNIGCGPAVEIQRFIKEEEVSALTQFTLMDFNDVTIAYTEQKIKQAIASSGRKPAVKIIQKSIDTLLKEAHDNTNLIAPNSYDFVYCAGLFDYFSDSVCKNLTALFYQWVKPGGLVTVTNVHANNPVKNIMEHLLEWYLVYRDEQDMEFLIPDEVQGEVIPDTTGVNVLLDIRKLRG
ncbi:MAG: class I SAM-dependent methyltransferase [Verrucomicrobiota bacterium]